MNMFSHLRHAVDWWLQGLAVFCPAALKHSMGLTPDKITIEFHEEEVVLRRYTVDSKKPLDVKRFLKTDNDQRLIALRWLHAQRENHSKLILVVSENSLLKKTLTFPSAAQSNLKEALGFELNRRTPFSPDQAYFDYQIVDHNKQTNKLQIELFVVPRQNIDPFLKLLNEWNISIDALKPVVTHPDDTKINLLPGEQRANTNKNTDYVTLSLATSAFLLFLAVLYMPLMQQARQLESLEEEMQIYRQAAIELQKIRDEKQNIIDQINFLNSKHKNALTGIELLNEVTKIIPDDTWLTRLIIKNNELQIQGESASASSLIQIIESSELFAQAQFRSPVTQNIANGKDKFNLSAKLVSKSTQGEEI